MGRDHSFSPAWCCSGIFTSSPSVCQSKPHGNRRIVLRPLKGRVFRKAILEAQESSNITSGFQKLEREPACSDFRRLGRRPKPYHLPGNKEALSTGSSLLYCNYFSFAFFPQAGPRAEGKPSSPEPPVTTQPGLRTPLAAAVGG